MRNPQRFSWDATTSSMFIADIGQNAVEEINVGANGGNFGWDDREGSFPFESNRTAGLTDPVAEYDHTNVVSNPPTNIGNRAVTVGEVARHTGIPGLDGLLLLSDFPTGLIFTLDVDNDPLDGGQDGLRELQPLDQNLQPVRLLELINDVRQIVVCRPPTEPICASVSTRQARFTSSISRMVWCGASRPCPRRSWATSRMTGNCRSKMSIY